MADAKLLARANRVLHRLDVLDDAMANVDAFWALLKDLNARDQSIVKFPHSAAIHMVRAGILRRDGTIMACLDPEDWRGNRASIGQILGVLKDTELVDLFCRVRGDPLGGNCGGPSTGKKGVLRPYRAPLV